MKISIAGFCTSFFIPAIQNLTFHLPHVHILGTNQFGDTCREAFKHHSAKQDVLYCLDYAEILVASVSHQIQSDYYGGNISVSIEGIASEHFHAPMHTETSGTTLARTRHDVFHSFFSDDIKEDSITTISHIKRIIELLKQRHIMSNMLSTTW